MRDVALFDAKYGPKLQWSGGLLAIVAVGTLSSFFIDLMQSLAMRSPVPVMNDVFIITGGIGAAIIVPVAGAMTGVPGPSKGWMPRGAKVTTLLVLLGVAIAMARYSKTAHQLHTEQQNALEDARAAKLEAERLATQSPEANARAEILAAQAKMLASSAEALERGARRLTPKVRQHAVQMAQLASKNLPQAEPAAAKAKTIEASQPPAVSTMRIIEAVVGPALTELLLAEIFAFVAAMWGAAAFAPVRSEEEIIKTRRHPSLQDVDLDRLNDDAREGLDEINGTWRGIRLGRPAERGRGRQAVLWPTLAVRGNAGTRVFIGSRQALAVARGPEDIDGE
ncbi:MAG: hypothetical protein AAF449_05465 [Myxococcota bacterium]